MKIKSAKSFRTWFKNKDKARQEASAYWDENFMGSQQGDKSGFFKMYHGEKDKIYDFLRKEVEMAEDGQAIYEFVQNAADSGSTQFYMFFNENYLVAINNGKAFNVEGIQSILNIGQSFDKDDDPDKIGRYGIGFKLVHRLVGKSSGLDELLNTDGQGYRGPVLFSWSKKDHFDDFLTFQQFEYDNIESRDIPWLLKILITNFPAQPQETVKDVEFADVTPFSLEEVKNYQAFLNSVIEKIDTNAMSQGSMFFIKLGEKKYEYLEKQKQDYLGGLSTSMHFLKSLQLIQINNEKIEKDHNATNLLEFVIAKNTDDYNNISLTEKRDKSSDIKFKICYADTARSAIEIKQHPNIYKFFPAVKEVNNLSFVIHSNVFVLSSNRQNLSETTPINRALLLLLSKRISEKMTSLKSTDKDTFKKLFISILMSDAPVSTAGNGWQKEFFYDKLLQYIKTNVPTENGFSDSSENVKINKSKLNLNLANFGLGYIQWFEWKDRNDQILLDEAQKKEKLGIEEWNICDIVEKANLNSINTWIANCSTEIYYAFLQELEDSHLREETKDKIRQIKFFQFSNGTWYSFNDIILLSLYSNGSSSYKFNNVIICDDKTSPIKDILQKIGFITSNRKISDYKNIFSSTLLPAEKTLYEYIAEKCKTNTLTSAEKKKLFQNFTNENTKFLNVGNATLTELSLFSNKNGEILPLKSLVSSQLQTPEWLRYWTINPDEYFDELQSYLIAELEIYPTIILNNWDSLITQTADIKSLYERTIYYYGLKDSNISLWKKSVKFVYTANGFKQANQVFFNTKMVELGNSYVQFQKAVLSLYGLPTPEKSIANYLLQEPFRIDGSIFLGRRFNKTELNVGEIKAVIQFCEANNEQFFKNCIISREDNNYFVFEKSDKFQITSPDEKARQFITKHCSDKLFVLPHDFIEYKEKDGIVKNLDLYVNIIDCVEVNDLQEELIDIILPHYVPYQAKLKFLNELSEIRLNPDCVYFREKFEYKVLDMACNVIKESRDFSNFKEKIIIEFNDSDLPRSKFSSSSDKVEIGGKVLSQSQILPNEAKNGNVLSNLLEQFVSQGLQKEKLYELFGIQSEADLEQIFEILSNEYSGLENAQQLAFLLLYDQEISSVNFDLFKVETLDDKSWELKYSYYTQAFSFIGDDYLLKPQYTDIKNILTLPKSIGKTDNIILSKPYFNESSFVCPGLKSDLSEEEKIQLVDFLYSEWGKDSNKQKIKNIDWSKIDDNDTEKLLGFNPNSCVYPAEYACESENLPDYILNWAGNSLAYKKYEDFADCNSEEEISQKLISILNERYEIKINVDKNGYWKMDNDKIAKVLEVLNAHYPDLLDFNQETATEVNVVFPKEDSKELVNLVNKVLKENDINFADVSIAKENSIKIKVAAWIKPDLFNRIGLKPEKSISIFTPKNPTELVKVDGATLTNGYYQVTSTEFKDFFYWKTLIESQNAGVTFRTKTSYYFAPTNAKGKKIGTCDKFKAGVYIENVCDFKYNIDAEQYTITIFAHSEAQYNAQLTRIKKLFPKISLQSSVYVYKYSLNFKSVVSGGKERIQFLSDMGVCTDGTNNAVIVDLRKFLKGNNTTFDKSRLSKYNGSETMLFNSFEYLKEKEIELSTPEQFEVTTQPLS